MTYDITCDFFPCFCCFDIKQVCAIIESQHRRFKGPNVTTKSPLSLKTTKDRPNLVNGASQKNYTFVVWRGWWLWLVEKRWAWIIDRHRPGSNRVMASGRSRAISRFISSENYEQREKVNGWQLMLFVPTAKGYLLQTYIAVRAYKRFRFCFAINVTFYRQRPLKLAMGTYTKFILALYLLAWQQYSLKTLIVLFLYIYKNPSESLAACYHSKNK